MHLKNLAPRLITVNTPDGKSFPLKPDETVHIDSELGVAQEYVLYLIESGQAIEVAAPKAEKAADKK